jgi:hypothetical protein
MRMSMEEHAWVSGIHGADLLDCGAERVHA